MAIRRAAIAARNSGDKSPTTSPIGCAATVKVGMLLFQRAQSHVLLLMLPRGVSGALHGTHLAFGKAWLCPMQLSQFSARSKRTDFGFGAHCL
jgi:hypothetical protein